MEEENLIVEILRLDFIREHGAVATICKVLGDHEDERVLNNRVIDILVNRVWDLAYL